MTQPGRGAAGAGATAETGAIAGAGAAAARPARDLVLRALAEIARRLQLEEGAAAGMELRAAPTAPAPAKPNERIGAVRVLRGPACELIYSGLHLPALGMDSHQLAAFTPAKSALPHFTLDAAHHAQSDRRIHFGCDLLPRVDPGASLHYLREVYAPLDSALQSACALSGITPIASAPLQRALHSPWQIAVFAEPDALPALAEPANTYLHHWLALCQSGLSTAVRANIAWQNPAERSRQNRAALFSPRTNRLWILLANLLGQAQCEQLRKLLAGEHAQ